MTWLTERSRRFFAQTGYPYPPSYKIVAEAGLMFFVVCAAIQRLVADPTVSEVLLVVAACLVGFFPSIAGYLVPRPHIEVFPVFVIVSVALFWTVPVHGDVAPLILGVAAAMSLAIVPPRQGHLYLAAYTVTAIVGVVLGATDQGVLSVLVVGFGGVVGRLLQVQLRAAEAQRQQRERQLVVDRAAVAAEVHDVVAHSLSIVLLNVTAARRTLDADDVDRADLDDARDALRDAERQGRSAMEDVRNTIELLRTQQPMDRPQPGLSDLDELIDGFRRAGTTVTTEITPPSGRLSAATELAVYRMVQESLTNAAKHAPGQPVTIYAAPAGERYAVRVSNPLPAGGRRRSGGYGLAGMAARVENLNGSVSSTSANGNWCVTAEFEEESADEAMPPGVPDEDCRFGGINHGRLRWMK